jgi:hypothetical protein
VVAAPPPSLRLALLVRARGRHRCCRAGTFAAAPSWNRCNCLAKEYTPQGAVVFKDVCTNEMAMNPP